MVRYAASIIFALSCAWPCLATTNYIYPLASWQVSTHQGDSVGEGLYHMGIDAGFDEPAGAPVYAVADGIVREAEERTQFGLVVLIDHTPEDEDPNVSLYGHLDPTDIRVTPGQSVQAGDIVGVLGSSENNGGWSVHLHFGIHKGAYTGEWVYYGHVTDPATGEDWHDPETYLPEHLLGDDWNPFIQLDLVDGDTIGNTVAVTGAAGDIGSTISKLRIKGSSDGVTWQTLSLDEDPWYSVEQTIGISSYPDGPFYLRVIARDGFNNKTVVTRSLTKDPYRYTTPAFAAMKEGKSDAFITVWSFGGNALEAFFPFGEEWNKGGLLTTADVIGSDQTDVIAVRKAKTGTTPLVKVFSTSGNVKSHFRLRGQTPIAVTAANQQIVIASTDVDQPITAYDASGTVLWSMVMPNPDFTITGLASNSETLYVCGQMNSQSRLYTVDIATTSVSDQFRPFSKYADTGCRVAVGDTLVVGSTGNYPGTVRQFSLTGEAIGESFRPFGDAFMGVVDVSAIQWDTVEDDVTEDELVVSQASDGQAWVKVYRITSDTELVVTDRVYEEEFTKGTYIAKL